LQVVVAVSQYSMLEQGLVAVEDSPSLLHK
jgi:hypothetical protein